jgi:hypothetical protein
MTGRTSLRTISLPTLVLFPARKLPLLNSTKTLDVKLYPAQIIYD